MRIGSFVGGGFAALLAVIGLKIAAEHGSGSHYQGGVALFLFLVAMLFWLITVSRSDSGTDSEASELVLWRALTRSVPDQLLKQ